MSATIAFCSLMVLVVATILGFTQGSWHYPQVRTWIIAALAGLADVGMLVTTAQGGGMDHVEWFVAASVAPVAWAVGIKYRHHRRMLQVAAAVEMARSGQFHDARKLLDDMIEKLLVSDGPYARSTLQVRNSFAEVCEQDGNHLAAIAGYQQSLADAGATIRRTDPAIVATRERLIDLLIESGRTAEVVAELTKQLEAHTDKLGGDHPTTAATRRKLTGQQALFPAPHPSAPSEPDNWFERCNHADQLAAAGMIYPAIAAYRQIQAHQTARVGADHPSVLAIRSRFIEGVRIGANRDYELDVVAGALLKMADRQEADLLTDYQRLG